MCCQGCVRVERGHSSTPELRRPVGLSCYPPTVPVIEVKVQPWREPGKQEGCPQYTALTQSLPVALCTLIFALLHHGGLVTLRPVFTFITSISPFAPSLTVSTGRRHVQSLGPHPAPRADSPEHFTRRCYAVKTNSTYSGRSPLKSSF